MTTYIIFSMEKPKYKVEADFYDVDKNFMSFYDDDDNLICSINIDEIDCVVDKEHINKLHFVEPVDEKECEKCEEVECELHPSNFEEPTNNESQEDKPVYTATLKLKPTNNEKSELDFDELFRRVLGLHGEK